MGLKILNYNNDQPTLIHYIYKISCPSGKYYIGRHSTKNINDGYMGSGKWVRQIKDKTKLLKEILEYTDTFEELVILEKNYLLIHIHNPNNMNYNDNATGWASGNLNYNCSPEVSERKRLDRMGKSFIDLYGEERATEIKKKISDSHLGKIRGSAWNSGLNKETDERVARHAEITSEATRKWMANLSTEDKKEKFGKQGVNNGFYNKEHSQETKNLLSEKRKSVKKIECQHCDKIIDAANFKRWHGDNCKYKNNRSKT